MNHESLKLQLSDGRILSYSECGDPKGVPILFFHGTPGSRLQANDFNQPAMMKGYRLFGIDRPGMGYSSANKNHSILGFTRDVEELVVHLGISQFSMIAHSGGAPFALAYTAFYPERVSHLAIVAGIAPVNLKEATESLSLGMRIIHIFVRYIPGFASILMYLTRMMHQKPSIFRNAINKLSEHDKKVFDNVQQFNSFLNTGNESFRQGLGGAAQEFKMVVSPWGFDLNLIRCSISIWYGQFDHQVPFAHAKIYEKLIPNAKLYYLENEGHLSVLYNNINNIFDTITNQSNLSR